VEGVFRVVFIGFEGVRGSMGDKTFWETLCDNSPFPFECFRDPFVDSSTDLGPATAL
jgi:hypothetical protein